MNKDIDEQIRSSLDKRKMVNEIKRAAKPVLPGKKTKIGRSSRKTAQSVTFLEIEKYVMPLGRTASGLNVLYGRETGYFCMVHGRDLQYTTFLEVGGPMVLQLVYRRERQQDDPRLSSDSVRDHFIVRCGERPLTEDVWCGQGFHRISNYLVLVSGRQALIWDGEKTEIIYEPLFHGNILRFDSTDVPIDLENLRINFDRMDDPNHRKAVIKKLHSCSTAWRFSGGDKIAWLIVGLILAMPLHACWTFRQNIWVIGPPGCGKTTFLNMLWTLFGLLCLFIQGSQSTAAGIMQKSAGNSTRLVLIDEVELTGAREKLVLMARGMSRQTHGLGGVKGSSQQRAIDVYANVLFILAALDQNINDEAERDRFCIIRMLRNDKHFLPFDRKEVSELGSEVLALSLWGYFRALALIDAVGLIPGFDQRLVEATITGPAMLVATLGGDAEAVRLQTVGILEEVKRDQPILQSNETQLLGDIFARKLRVATYEDTGNGERSRVYRERAISQLIGIEEFKDDLEAVGIKSCEDGIFLVPSVIQQQILRGTLWEGRGIIDHLLRLPGAERRTRRVARYPRHGIMLPLDVSYSGEGYGDDTG